MWCDSRASSWPTTLQPLFLGRKPKARVAADKNMTKFHEKTYKLHLKYLKERDRKVYKMNKNMVSVLANLSFAMCQTFIKDQIQMHS
jgi:hypothetical protein